MLKIVFLFFSFFVLTRFIGQRDYGQRSDAGKKASSGCEWIFALRSLLLKCMSRDTDGAVIPMVDKQFS